MFKACFAILPAEMKAKTRVHYGSHTECHYLLNTFGIPRVALPFTTMGNNPILEDHLVWCKQRLKEEESPAAGNRSDFNRLGPNQYDVLFAGGRNFSGDGNEALRSLAMKYLQNYNGGNPKERKTIVDSVADHVIDNGGRFLKLDADGSSWVEMSIPDVRVRITQMFRNLRQRGIQLQKEKSPDATSSHLPLLDVSDIAPTDILFGRNVGHYGNQQLRDMVEFMLAEYNAASRGRKKQLVESLIKEIKSLNGRFLRLVEGGKWQEVPDDAIVVSKLSSHFRNYRRIKR